MHGRGGVCVWCGEQFLKKWDHCEVSRDPEVISIYLKSGKQCQEQIKEWVGEIHQVLSQKNFKNLKTRKFI